MQRKNELISEIIAIELEMFLTVPAREPVPCQGNPESFRIHRSAQFSAWSQRTLESYFDDLKHAKSEGINLMTLKYALMEGLIPHKNLKPLVRKIASIQYAWQEEMFQKYPAMMSGARSLSSISDSEYRTSFETYLSCELETYSEATLASLYEDILQKHENGINMSEEIYAVLVRSQRPTS